MAAPSQNFPAMMNAGQMSQKAGPRLVNLMKPKRTGTLLLPGPVGPAKPTDVRADSALCLIARDPLLQRVPIHLPPGEGFFPSN